MRVVAVVSMPSRRIGATAATKAYLAYLAALGHTVTLVTPDDVTDAVTSADIVLSHAGNAAVAAAYAARSGKPNVRMVHGEIDDPAAFDGAALVVFNSYHLAASVDCPAPWIVCRPPVDASRYRTTPGDHVTLVNLSEAKGGELFWRLARCAPHRRFLGVIGAHGNQYVDRLPNVEVIDTTDRMRDAVYGRTRILLMPSDYESWGMVGVEAMASGIPVIAHPCDGLHESLGAAGIFVDRDDGQAWLDEIERLHDPDEWAAASARSLARSAELDPTEDLERFARHLTFIHTGALCDLARR